MVYIKLFRLLGSSLQIKEPVPNDQLEHDSLPLFHHGITYKFLCSYCIIITDLLITFSILIILY